MKLFKWPRKISWKLTIVYTLMFIIVLLILNGAVYLFLRNFVVSNAVESIDSALQFILPKLKGVDRESLARSDVDILQDISESRGNIYFRILDQNQKIIIQSNMLKGFELPLQSGYSRIKAKNRQFISKNIVIAKYGFLNGYLQVVRDVTVEYNFLEALLFVLLITSAVGGIGAIIIGYVITRRTLKPINEITNTARSLSVSDLGKRLEVEGPEDELTNLARTFNSMLSRLEKAFERQQQFVSDASHELRTPISVIQGYINLLDRWGKEEAEIRDEAIEAIKNEVESMNSLMESLLFLARGDSDELEIEKGEFWIDEVIDELIRESTMIADEVEVCSEKNIHYKYFGDRKMIKQLLRIFIDNSIKFTFRGGKIKINAQKEDDNLKLSVSDTGCGIPEAELSQIFDRFYQVDKSRSDQEGAGLGLAIARWIIDIHDGNFEIESEVGEGTEISVLLPCNQDGG